VILGLLLLQRNADYGDWLTRWALYDVLWAIPAGLLCGYAMGRGLSHFTLRMRVRNEDSTVSPNDYLTFALIALAYVLAELVHGYGFLAVFAAGLGLRQTEVHASNNTQEPAELLVQPLIGHQTVDPQEAVHGDVETLEETQVAAGIMLGDMLFFGGLVERAMEVFLVTLLGVVLIAHWDWRSLVVAAALFLLVRPLSVLAMPWGRLLDARQRLLVGWFGIRGIGSLYYLFHVLNQSLAPAIAASTLDLTLSVVALSILFHGFSTQPMLARYERNKKPPLS
jgi:NhaP-type Na+/H+ or K+/H+ antiporter